MVTLVGRLCCFWKYDSNLLFICQSVSKLNQRFGELLRVLPAVLPPHVLHQVEVGGCVGARFCTVRCFIFVQNLNRLLIRGCWQTVQCIMYYVTQNLNFMLKSIFSLSYLNIFFWKAVAVCTIELLEIDLLHQFWIFEKVFFVRFFWK